ncbi:unnamed protein product [Rotaria sordida]|uniref:Uncharacterized protein n=1 Tax=Rotaria sordida TaxID=392033 RepID=A0A814I4Z9_9BILA|nr:unnamed protein product [Rotaria sordida]CAF3689687.1 unnamed protein product [Rotaria sordida]
MRFIFFIVFIRTILSSRYHDVIIGSDDDCWSNEKDNTIEKKYATLVKFSPEIAYGKDNCSVHIISPWLPHMQNGFGLFVSREMDCSSTLIVDCLSDTTLINRTKSLPVQFTCHTSQNKIEMPCNSISLTFKRNIKVSETKKTTLVQVIALAKKPCIDDDIFFQCPTDYPDSCIDRKLKCNGRSECPSGDDELDCHRSPAKGISIIVIFFIILAFLFLICVLSTVFICCCCRAAFNRIMKRFRSQKENKSHQKVNVTTTGEDAILIKELTAPTVTVEILPQQQIVSAPLIIDSTKPIYPRLE